MGKAEAIARSLNGRIVRVVQSTEAGIPAAFIADRSEYSTNAMSNMAMKSESVSTPVQAGSVNIRSQVVLVVDISI